jgi:hypothetical protein
MMRSDEDKKIMGSETGFVSRWSRRKLDAKNQGGEEKSSPVQHEVPSLPEQPPLTDADMPSIEELTADSDYSGFLSPEVSDELRKLALRKLFHGVEFNVCDGLDDYDGDYTKYTKLGDIITADMKHQMEMEARKILASDEGESEVITEAKGEQKALDKHSDAAHAIEPDADSSKNEQLAETLLGGDEADLQSEL